MRSSRHIKPTPHISASARARRTRAQSRRAARGGGSGRAHAALIASALCALQLTACAKGDAIPETEIVRLNPARPMERDAGVDAAPAQTPEVPEQTPGAGSDSEIAEMPAAPLPLPMSPPDMAADASADGAADSGA